MSTPSVRPALLALAVSGFAAPRSAEAVFHLWEIREVYSNENGSIQYIELSTTFAGQGFVNAHDITATSDGVEHTFTFDSNVVGDTTDRTLLIATPEFTALAGATVPDYTLPCGPFFDPDAVAITIDFVGADSVDFAGADLPAGSSDALYFTIAGATSTAANTPQNFAGVDGFLAPLAWGQSSVGKIWGRLEISPPEVEAIGTKRGLEIVRDAGHADGFRRVARLARDSAIARSATEIPRIRAIASTRRGCRRARAPKVHCGTSRSCERPGPVAQPVVSGWGVRRRPSARKRLTLPSSRSWRACSSARIASLAR